MVDFKDSYFIELIKNTNLYKVLFLMDDGNIYRTQEQAEERVKNALKCQKIVRWCKVEEGKEPINNQELEIMFIKNMNNPPVQPIQKKQEKLTDEEAKALLEMRKQKSTIINEDSVSDNKNNIGATNFTKVTTAESNKKNNKKK